MSDGGKGSSPRPYSVSNEEYANRWDAIFGRDQQEKALAKLVEVQDNLDLKRWKFEGHNNHKNHLDYKCKVCGWTDWIPNYGTVSQLSCKCK